MADREHYPTFKEMELRRFENNVRDLPVEALRILSDLLVLIVRGERQPKRTPKEAGNG